MAVLSLLLVDDNPAYARLTSLLVAEALGGNPTIRCAGSVGDAEAALAAAPADLVLLDLGLPDSEGFSGLERVRAACPECRVVVLSGRSDRGIEARARAAGAAAYVLKGSEIEQLGPAVHAALGTAWPDR